MSAGPYGAYGAGGGGGPAGGGPPQPGGPYGAYGGEYRAEERVDLPQADPERLRAAAAAWERLAGAIQGIAQGGSLAAGWVTEANFGPAVTAFQAFWQERYQQGALPELEAACREVARRCREFADAVEDARRKVTAINVVGGFLTVVGLVAIIVSFGASSAAAAGGAAAARAAAVGALQVLRQVLVQMVKGAVLGAARGALAGFSYDFLVVRPLRVAANPRVRYGVGDAWRAAFQGAIAGGASGAVPVGRGRLRGRLGHGITRQQAEHLVARRLRHLPQDVREQVVDAVERARTGKVRFQRHDGKVFENKAQSLPAKPYGYYHEWTAAATGQKRGPHRVIIGGDPKEPDVIYYWDHQHGYVQVYP